MRYLLDTCALSELTKPVPSKALVDWLRRAAEDTLFISVLTLGELERGVQRLPGTKRKASLEGWLGEIRESYAGRILDITTEVARDYGRTGARVEAKGRPIPVVDGLIGSTALVHDLTVVTRNTKDIQRTGARTLNPWD